MLFFLYRIRNEVNGSNFHLGEPWYLLVAFAAGILAFLLYTASWYFILGHSAVSFKKLLLLNLMGSYVSISVNSALGALIKCRYLGISWVRSIGAYSVVVVFELLPGLFVLLLEGSWYAVFPLILFLWAIFHEDSLYRVIARLFKLLRQEKFINEFYSGWKLAKKGNLPAAFFSTLAQVFFSSLALISTGRAFGWEFRLTGAFVAVLYSTVLGMIGTPGGIGGNELGIVLALDIGGKAVGVAFLYKFLTQYVYIIPGAFVFYRVLSSQKSLLDA
ncbi:lysylphosphatidylglycerol synthase domain-containing protein [Thermococcus waiotapuensis]|uniref:Lysylphosphatidylglycerol synthase domain-containing protein n=1 Tax=Thermococcus waiotapuensis TaxID=90909 RepID=A0AAE4NWL2_9EURY|nr:lysylphosphatidylglycerol synthase domain-containing protein [Thermococcus waiotapuensis]MDV3104622.1 lysylphosphatidylglycerol synthase domain-containing protein [Thermococcus waiotapuensis]